ncbi:cidABC operon transcriptional activator CidR [Gracilibacillus alcaliphilus]|uniref:cidABC operon transcriptional activator CidR n=1 Tax=Gracilibacillus alcaliphilus TaxID=1401441 RepID=UPI0019581B4A|nr:LysR family transcriptional regulator [Gracilibacillus alcaliphilus]MBM7676741.1 DNA-binding transcriptional LysR family regulator [Gracilibacillus alcaliphilus]
MEIKHMIYFIEIIKTGSMTKAAENLFISQPTISKLLRDLEAELGVELFDRHKRQLMLTDAGKAFLEQAKEIVRLYKNLPTEMDNLLGLRQGHIKIGLPPIMNVNLFIHILGEFHERYPDITFQLAENGSKRIEESIINDEVDIGITVLPTDTDKFHQFFLLEEQLKLVVPRTHRLANREKIDFAELAEEDFILFNKDFALNDRIIEACKTAGFIPKVIAESSQWNFIEQMIVSNLGVSILPASIIDMLHKNIVSVELNNPSILWQLAIIWKKNSYTSFVTKEWLKFIQEQLMLQHDNEQE